MSLPDEIKSYVDDAVARAVASVRTAAGTVITSPQARSTDTLTVVIDGSATALPVKQFRGTSLMPGMRVGLVRIGSDWVAMGSLTNVGFGSGATRMVIGADTPPELQSFGIDLAILSYVRDKNSGLEVGYHFIGSSNRFDGLGDGRVLAFGNVTYPTPGSPSSATQSDVKTNFQMNMWAQYPQTVFKDHTVTLWSNLSLESANGFNQFTVDGHIMDHGFIDDASDANSTGTITTETTIFTVPSATYRAGRAFRAVVSGHFNFSASNGLGRLRLYRNSTSGTLLCTWFFGPSPGAFGGDPGDYKHFEQIFKNGTGGDVTDTIICTLTCFTAGNVKMFSGSDNIRRLEIFDHGAAGDHGIVVEI